jgi:putative lipoprotein (rSAM/lipoprotein system)
MARVSKIYRMLISALLALLGFSCANTENVRNSENDVAPAANVVPAVPASKVPAPSVEYGVPSATYKAKGIVVSEADNSPIKGIRTELKGDSTIATVYTDSEGFFSLKGSVFPRKKLYVVLTDVDGELNGSFVKMEVEADYTDKTFTGGSGWYSGEAEIDLEGIKMKPE